MVRLVYERESRQLNRVYRMKATGGWIGFAFEEENTFFVPGSAALKKNLLCTPPWLTVIRNQAVKVSFPNTYVYF